MYLCKVFFKYNINMKQGLTTLFLLFVMGITAFAQCPFGEGSKENCIRGCGWFVDENNDGFCDNGLVKQAAEIKQKTTNPSIDSAKAIKEQIKTKEQRTETLFQQTKTKEEKTDINQQDSQTNNHVSEVNAAPSVTPKSSKQINKPYPLMPISVAVLVFYFTTMLLVKLKKIKKITHRRIWNVVLLISFILSCFGGFYLIFQLNYHYKMHLFPLYMKIHVLAGIVMTLIGMIHILWHLVYFKRIFSAKKQCGE